MVSPFSIETNTKVSLIEPVGKVHSEAPHLRRLNDQSAHVSNHGKSTTSLVSLSNPVIWGHHINSAPSSERKCVDDPYEFRFRRRKKGKEKTNKYRKAHPVKALLWLVNTRQLVNLSSIGSYLCNARSLHGVFSDNIE